MARRKHRRAGRRTAQPEVVHPEAAGLDVGATAMYAAVRADRASPAISGCHPVRTSREAIADYESRIEYWDAATEVARAVHGR